MGLFRYGSSLCPVIKAGMALFLVDEDWGHAMLVEPSGEGLEVRMEDNPPRVNVLHMVPPLHEEDAHQLNPSTYLGVYASNGSQDRILKDVCAAMHTLKALARENPLLGLLSGSQCYSVSPAGVLTSIMPINGGEKKTSCAGLVEDCYRYIGVPLVNEATIPEMGFDEFRRLFVDPNPRMARWSERRLRRRLGISQDAEFVRPYLTSYQMRAFDEEDFPYAVHADDPKTVVSWRTGGKR